MIFLIITQYGVLIFSFIENKPIAYANDESYPVWSQVLGWLMAWVSVVVVPGVAVYILYQSYSDPEYEGLNFGRAAVIYT